MSIERRILVEFKKRLRDSDSLSLTGVEDLLNSAERFVVESDAASDKKDKRDAMIGLIKSPELLSKILEN